MNRKNLAHDINAVLKTMDEQLALAKKATYALRVDLVTARETANNVKFALELVTLQIIAANDEGILQPPDVLDRIYNVRDELIQIEHEIRSMVVVTEIYEARQHNLTKNVLN
jgi:hypothetical protein